MFFRFIILCLFLVVSLPVFALEESNDVPSVTIPVEVALTYQKKQAKTPDFKDLAKSSPAYINAPDFAKNVFLYQEAESLKEIYNGIDDRSAFVIFDDFKIKEFNREKERFSFKNFDFDTHYTYKYNGETYVIFISNINDYQYLPVESRTSFYISSAMMNDTFIASELTLRPVIADKTPFILDDETPAHLILADLVDIKLIRYESGKVIYHNIASEWKAKSRIDKIVKDIMPNSF